MHKPTMQDYTKPVVASLIPINEKMGNKRTHCPDPRFASANPEDRLTVEIRGPKVYGIQPPVGASNLPIQLGIQLTDESHDGARPVYLYAYQKRADGMEVMADGAPVIAKDEEGNLRRVSLQTDAHHSLWFHPKKDKYFLEQVKQVFRTVVEVEEPIEGEDSLPGDRNAIMLRWDKINSAVELREQKQDEARTHLYRLTEDNKKAVPLAAAIIKARKGSSLKSMLEVGSITYNALDEDYLARSISSQLRNLVETNPVEYIDALVSPHSSGTNQGLADTFHWLQALGVVQYNAGSGWKCRSLEPGSKEVFLQTLSTSPEVVMTKLQESYPLIVQEALEQTMFAERYECIQKLAGIKAKTASQSQGNTKNTSRADSGPEGDNKKATRSRSQSK